LVAVLFSALHLLALGLGLGSVWSRGRALRGGLDDHGLKGLFFADNLWGVAAVLWLGTGLARAFFGIEKGWQFYVYNGFFWVKMAMFAAILLIELWPMITFIRWRIASSQGKPLDTRRAPWLARMNDAEVVLIVLIPFVAAAMARGLWMIPA